MYLLFQKLQKTPPPQKTGGRSHASDVTKKPASKYLQKRAQSNTVLC